MDELLRMLGTPSSGPSLPWIWIIQYLSSLREIDISTIRALIETAPVSYNKLREDTSEMVALRCLEELFGPNDGDRNISPPDSKVSFDPSARCQDVLRNILQEETLLNLRKGGAELLRWDIHPFIMHKRASLPKCALEQLKDFILKEIPVLDGDGDENESTSRSNDDNQEGNLIPQIVENDNEVLQGDRNIMSMLNDLQLKDKRPRHDAAEQIPITLHCNVQLEDELERTVTVTGTNFKYCRKDSQGGEGNEDMLQSDAVGHVEMRDNEMENAPNGDMMDASNRVKNLGKTLPLGSPNSSADRLQQNIDAGEDKDSMENPSVEELCESGFKRLKRNRFLSSQCTVSQEPPKKSGCTEKKLCTKCNTSGQVLVCSSVDCTTVVHETCLGSPANFDDKGNFFCPYCAYSISISKYLEYKEKASLAREELALFIVHCSKELNQNPEFDHEPSASCLNGNKLCVEEETFLAGALEVEGEKKENEEKVARGHLSMIESEQKGDELPANQKCSASDDNPTNHNSETIHANQVDVEGGIKNTVQPQNSDLSSNDNQTIHNSETIPENQVEDEGGIKDTVQPQNSDLSSDDNPTNHKSETIPANQVEVRGGIKDTVQPQNSDPQGPVSDLINDGEELYSMRSRKHDTRCTSRPIPKLRRKKVPWTKDEEEMLRKGVKKFGCNSGNFPWKRILEYGTSVFLNGRTTIDLKDKWRNMCKGSSPKCK